MGNGVVEKTRMVPGFWLKTGSRIVEWLGLRLFDAPEWGALSVTLPNGRTRTIGDPQSEGHAHIKLNNLKLFGQIMRRGTVGFAAAFMKNDVDSDNLTAVFRFFLKNRDLFDKAGKGLVRKAARDFAYHRSRRNSREGAKKNISEHYDLGNDFYELWLDPSMTYSSAYFSSDGQTLEDAQLAKYHLIADAAGVKKGASILEIGSGWGGFAEVAAKEYQSHLYGISLSKEQIKYANARIKNLGLGNHATFHFEDYRDTNGKFDHVCSIEMIEAVGEENWPSYFKAVHDALKPGGTAAIQAITINEEDFKHYRQGPDFIQRYIFPGGMLLTEEAMLKEGERAGLKFTNTQLFGASYARTLAMWRKKFIEQWPKIRLLGYDEEFRRKWIYYLSYCEAGFAEGSIDVGIYSYSRTD